MRGRPKKPEFDFISDELKDAINGMTKEEINGKISTVAKAESVNKEAMKADEHLKECRVQTAEAAKQYKDNTKANNQIIKYCMRVLDGRGQE